jgi:methylenetetrahydrofolate reductase (NADPH)
VADLAELAADGRSLRSVEIWPARNEAQAARLGELIEVLRGLPLDFVTVTYGARGSARERSLRLVEELVGEGWPVVAHLACLGHTREELRHMVRWLARLRPAGVLALRGDPPLDGDPVGAGGSCHALDLVELIRAETSLPVAVALHPDGHPEARSLAEDRAHAAEKLALADVGFTQFYFDGRSLEVLVAEMQARGVATPVVPGFMLPASRRQLHRMAAMAGIEAPAQLIDAPEERFGEVAARHVESLAAEALAARAPGLHLFSMNQPGSVRRFLARFPA